MVSVPAPNKYPVCIPRDPATSSFHVVTREVWAHRDLPAADDSEYPDVRPVNAVTRDLLGLFRRVNSQFTYKPKYTPPRRVLTNPSIPRHNDGMDNENYDLIMHVGDVLGSETAGDQSAYCWKKGSRYTLIDMLGQGTFGQVVKCRDENTGKLVAVKVLKNKPAYFKQGLLEIGILTVMNTNADRTGERRTLRFLDHFLYRNHLCLVNELLSVNLYELIKQNGFRGVSANLIRVFTRQILDALIAMDEAEIVHCDLKPENILLQQVQGTDVTLIDFGSACFEKSTMYSYIQSRHYRSPEVLLGLRYTCAIDMWSLGCIAAELFLGIPVFPGANEYNQLYKIMEMLGPPPAEMIRIGSRAAKFFRPDPQRPGQYVFKTMAEYEHDTGAHVDFDKKYFIYRNLPELVAKYPMKTGCDPSNTNPACQDKEIRRSFLHFLNGCLQIDPTKRWTPNQARAHPFINEIVLPDQWTPPPPLRPIPENSPPPQRDPSSRVQLDVNGAYHTFCLNMKEGRVIDVASRTVLTELRFPLQPPYYDSTPPAHLPTRGNRSRSKSEARIRGLPVEGTTPPQTGISAGMAARHQHQLSQNAHMMPSAAAAATSAAAAAGSFTIGMPPIAQLAQQQQQQQQQQQGQQIGGDPYGMGGMAPRVSVQASQAQPVPITAAVGHTRKSTDRISCSANAPSAGAISSRMASRRTSAGKQRRSKKLTSLDSMATDLSAQQPFDMDAVGGSALENSPLQQSPMSQYQPSKVQVPQQSLDAGPMYCGGASWSVRPSGMSSRLSSGTSSGSNSSVLPPPPPLIPDQASYSGGSAGGSYPQSQPQAVPNGRPPIELGSSVTQTAEKYMNQAPRYPQY